MIRILIAALLVAAGATQARADDAADRAQRWNDLREAIFGDRQVTRNDALVQLDMPTRALDAALVPVAITFASGASVRSVTLVIDGNPAPLAAKVDFGPAADPHRLELRIRVNENTNIQAVAETADGGLVMTERFIKAAGGCSAPAGPDDATALEDIGRMRLHLLGSYEPGKPLAAQLLIRHPNFNGMQMNQLTRLYTPARFIDAVDVAYAGTSVLHIAADISLSTDPAITFSFIPSGPGALEVHAHDSKDGTFADRFAVPAAGS